jgi:hypothetical protein
MVSLPPLFPAQSDLWKLPQLDFRHQEPHLRFGDFFLIFVNLSDADIVTVFSKLAMPIDPQVALLSSWWGCV